jgi:hypothetical protein
LRQHSESPLTADSLAFYLALAVVALEEVEEAALEEAVEAALEEAVVVALEEAAVVALEEAVVVVALEEVEAKGALFRFP